MSELSNVATYLDQLATRTAATDPRDVQRSIRHALTDAAYSLSDLDDRRMAGHRGPFTVDIPEDALIFLTIAAMRETGYPEGNGTE